MTTERDPATRIVLSWLREDAHENAERVLLLALDEVESTPQRRSWWPARRLFMSTYAKLVAAAAALLVVAVVGYNLIPGTGVGGATPVPTESPGPIPAPLPSDDTVGLAAGTYVTGSPFPVRVTATVPAGWHGHVAGPYYADLWLPGGTGDNGLYFVLPSKIPIDPCDYPKGFAAIGGDAVDDLTAALRRVPGLRVTDVSSTSIDGYLGTQLVLTAPSVASSCKLSPEGFAVWQLPLGGISPGLAAGESIRLWIVEVEGKRLVIVVQDTRYTADQRAQAQAIFDSLQIKPSN